MGGLFHTRQDGRGSLNLLGYSNARADALIERFDAARDEPERLRAYRALHALLAEDLPYLFLWQELGVAAWRKDLLQAGDGATPLLTLLSTRPAWAPILPKAP